MAGLRIFLFGNMRLIHDGQLGFVKAPHAVMALMAYLLLQPHHSCPRELLASLFWGDQCQERARRCLNTTLWRLRQVLEPEGIPQGTYLLSFSSDEISFNWESNYWVDAVSFEEQINSVLSKSSQVMGTADVERMKEALRLYNGELLEGFYDDWVIRERERLRRLFLISLAHLMHYFSYCGAFEESLTCGQRILDQDPLREEIHREMMRLYYQSGQRALALQQYHRCCEILKAELGISPMEETQALLAQINQCANSSGGHEDHFAPASELDDYSRVLQQLRLSKRAVEEAREQLQRAIQLAEQLINIHQ